jgi:hypothetical protein
LITNMYDYWADSVNFEETTMENEKDEKENELNDSNIHNTPKEGGTFENIVRALTIYKEHYGHVNVPSDFIFEKPEAIAAYYERQQMELMQNEENKGNLDDVLSSMISGNGNGEASSPTEVTLKAGDYVVDEEGNSMGHKTDINELISSNSIPSSSSSSAEDTNQHGETKDNIMSESEAGKASLESFFASLGLDTNNMDPSQSPFDCPVWPEDFLDMPLGNIVEHIRCGNIAAKEIQSRRSKLDDLGFDWEAEHPNRYLNLRFDLMVVALFTYNKIYGNSEVPREFIIPPEVPWPVHTYGLQLGEMVNTVRRNEYLLKKEFPERVELLELFGFDWWVPVEETDLSARYRIEEETAQLEKLKEQQKIRQLNIDEDELIDDEDEEEEQEDEQEIFESLHQSETKEEMVAEDQIKKEQNAGLVNVNMQTSMPSVPTLKRNTVPISNV